MDFWKDIDLTIFTPVPFSELVPGKRYIMYGNDGRYPGMRFKIKFIEQVRENMIRIDVLEVKFREPTRDTSIYYIGTGRLYNVASLLFYDYDALNPMNPVMREISGRREIPSLFSMAQNRLSTQQIEEAKAKGLLGGLKTRKRRKRRKSNKKTSRRK